MNFHKEFLNELTSQMYKPKRSKCTNIFRNQLLIRAKILCITEKVLCSFINIFRFLTKNIITKDKMDIVFINKENYFINNLIEFEKTFYWLDDDESKKRYIHYIAFKSLNSFLARLRFNWDTFQKNMALVQSQLQKNNSTLNIKNFTHPVDLLHDTNDTSGMVQIFIDEQYAYKDIITVQENDIVIDCGGGSGDTSLYFCAKGAKLVYVYEFLTSNLNRIKKHRQANPEHEHKIHIIDNAVWNTSNTKLSFVELGNASKVGEEHQYPNKTETLAIDELAKKQNLDRVDFIKMDIEGAEIPALEGAKEVIQTFKPKLAISVYHKNDDLITIPALIKQYNPEYKFFFDYYTDTGAEAILYAI